LAGLCYHCRMLETKVVLFDADGVVIVPQKVFARQYAQAHNLQLNDLETFFRGPFSQAIIGNADLKDLIREHHKTWRWDGDPQGLLDMWFRAENGTDKDLLEIIAWQRTNGKRVSMATNQEKYRANYLREIMFPGIFDDIFVSSEIGYMKREPEFWTAVLQRLRSDMPGIDPTQVVFFDDSQDSIEGARKAGVSAYLYEGIDQVKRVLT
jgi:HAD superfamily hydrolase (TIGR01509 family)